MPMLAVTTTGRPSTWTESPSTSLMRPATAWAAAESVLRQTTTNSSPPSLATVSAGRTAAPRRPATSVSRTSPAR
jgi:hypothetical protein